MLTHIAPIIVPVLSLLGNALAVGAGPKKMKHSDFSLNSVSEVQILEVQILDVQILEVQILGVQIPDDQHLGTMQRTDIHLVASS